MLRNTKIIIILLTTNLFFSQNIDFPDTNFKNALLNDNSTQLLGDLSFSSSADTNNDGEISFTEAEAVIGLSIAAQNITSLSGIEHFINIIRVDCSDNNISSLDFSDNLYLEEIWCFNSNITALNINNNTLLEHLDCGFNNLTSLNIDNNSNLFDLYCDNNLLTNINTSNNVNLFRFFCRDNQITSLNLSNNLNLQSLGCGYNQIASLDIANNISLEFLYCQENQLTTLDFGDNTVLETLHCWDNNIANLELSNLVNLRSLHCNTNNLSSLDVSNNTNLENLYFNSNTIASIDLSLNSELIKLNCSANQLNNIDVSANLNLEELRCSDNTLPSLNIENSVNLLSLYANNCDLTTIDVSNNPSLENVSIRDNQFTQLDFNNNPNLFDLGLSGNTDLVSLFLKNGSNYPISLSLNQLTSLQYVCVDDDNISYIQDQLNDYSLVNVAVNTLCTFAPGGTFYTVEGQTKVNLNNSGCNTNYPFLKLSYTDNNNASISGSYITDASGNFSVPLQAGSYSFNVEFENSDFFTVSPENLNVDFPTDNSPFLQDFCLTPNSTFNDLEIVIIPIENAIPGFNSLYKIVYKNSGDSVVSGDVTFTYQNDDVMSLVSANPTADLQNLNTLTWNFTNLLPFESREILVNFILNTPMDNPPLNGGDFLNFEATINAGVNDITADNNDFGLKQEVVNSFDPNDITCLEGDIIRPDKVGEFVHYLIRFENTGTANAINVVLKDVLNTSMFDVTSLVPLEASHNFYTRIENENVVEFIFEDINLPFDDLNNDGYILFKIKTLNTLVEGDYFDNIAEIYFDFNFPIITNTAVTNIESGLNVEDFSDHALTLFPNPIFNELHLKANHTIREIKIYDTSGRLIISNTLNIGDTETSTNLEGITLGTYFVKVKTDLSEQTLKFIKE